MAAPLKPWEVNMTGNIPVGSVPYVPNNNTARLHSSAIPFPEGGGGGGGGSFSNQIPSTSQASSAPPLPPRGGNQLRPIYSAYNNRSSSMMPYGGISSYSNSPYGGGMYSNPLISSPYSSYNNGGMINSPYGGMMNRPFGGYGSNFGQLNHHEPSFSQMAEESASPAFQSIESFVGAFCSISTMMESTFHALYSSFRAVIGVADHLGRVKKILSALTIFRFFKWVFRRFLYLVGISKIKPADVESLWNNLSSDTSGDPLELLHPINNKPSSWPILMFLGFIFAGPYLMWKLVKSLNFDSSLKDKKTWATGKSEHFVAVAEYPFEPMGDRELELKSGQVIRLAPSKLQPADARGWVLASDGFKIGLVPTNYIKIKGKGSSRDPIPSLITNKRNQHHQLNSVMMMATPERRQLDSILQEETLKADSNSLSNNYAAVDGGGISSDDDTDTLVGDEEILK